jgi:hypothetical protein
MTMQQDFAQVEGRIVYVKQVPVSALPVEVREQAGDLEELFAVHDAKGQQLALVANRRLAYSLAREHDYRPVSVH